MNLDDAKALVRILLNNEITEDEEIDDMGISSLKEVTNIVCCSYLSAISEFLGLILLPSVPQIVIDDFRAIISSVYLEFTGDEEFVLCVETIFHFKDPDKELKTYEEIFLKNEYGNNESPSVGFSGMPNIDDLGKIESDI